MVPMILDLTRRFKQMVKTDMSSILKEITSKIGTREPANTLIANLVSVKNFGCFMRFSNK
jgi:hypothetical protein